ncbi:DUF5686 family protein [Christiangramia aquimixticola]|uniref:DUF5686 family protein n=1 Tax=Christiangramia aquimixticola TaxID=1697558 RepID=UPI003AA8E762
MTKLLTIAFLFISVISFSQSLVSGRVIDIESRKPLAYAKLEVEGRQILANIDGSFELMLTREMVNVKISYIGYKPVSIQVNNDTKYIQAGLKPIYQQLETVNLQNDSNPANRIIKKAIESKSVNDPEQALECFSYKSYSKFIIDNEKSRIQLNADSTSSSIKTILNEGRGYLSEKVAEHIHSSSKKHIEKIEGIRTAGFKDPVYNVLTMEVNPFSLYQDTYQLYKTDYAGPLGQKAFPNYEYKIIDTTSGNRPAYVIHFKPKREHIVAGLEGLLYLDTLSYSVQKAKAQLLGSVRLIVEHDYKFYPEENIWFPKSQTTTIKPGAGGKEVAVFGGTIGLATVQQKQGIMGMILGAEKIERDLYLTSEVVHYNINLDHQASKPLRNPEILVQPEALIRSHEFWQENRKLSFTRRDEATEEKVEHLIEQGNIERKIRVKNAMATGYYPLKYWDIDLSKFFKYNIYEGLRLGTGGKTNEDLSTKFNLHGYVTYGFKDEAWKYGAGTQIYLNKENHTSLNLDFSKDLNEVASFDYLKGSNPFSILEPRFVNTNNYYKLRSYSVGLEHKITPSLDAQIQMTREEIGIISDYLFNLPGFTREDYDLAIAKFSVIWQPFSRYLRTPEGDMTLERKFPQFTGQVDKAFEELGGELNFTRLGLKAEHEIKRLDQSRTEFILEGNYGFGDLPLSHAFHANPNNPNKEKILYRFSVAGRNSFETMYFNEFYSDRQLIFHVRHQLTPFRISKNIRPELVFLSRHAVGDYQDAREFENLEFKTLERGYHEAGLELNKLIGGLGLSTAYRYGAYHLPTFKENFSFKFTFQLEL